MIVTAILLVLSAAFFGCLIWIGWAMDATDRDVQRLLREMREMDQ